MKKVSLNFANQTLEMNYDHQSGIETVDDLNSKKAAALAVFNISDCSPTILELDFEQGLIRSIMEDGSVVDQLDTSLYEKEMDFFASIGFGQVNLTNTVDIIEMLMNDEISPELMLQLLELEGQQNDRNKVVTEALEILKNMRRGD